MTIFQGALLTSVRAHWIELVVATGLSAVIDLDHFIEAKSLSLKVVITLKVVVNYVKTI